MITHSNDADYCRLGNGLAASFDEKSAYPVLIVNDRGEKTVAAFDAQSAMKTLEFLQKHRPQLEKALEIGNEQS
jgi:hypothetical protein